MLFYFVIIALIATTVILLYKQRSSDIKLVHQLVANQNFYLDGTPINGANLSLVSVIRVTPKHKVGIETHFTIYCFEKDEQKPLCINLELINNKLKKANIRASKGLQLNSVMDNLVLD